jgi:hypothetical protein
VSFAKIAEARAVKKIVIYLRREAVGFEGEADKAESLAGLLPALSHKMAAESFRTAARLIETGAWKDVKLPKRRAIPKLKPRKKVK